MIGIDSLSKRYGRREVLKSISAQMPAGSCVALIGPNGSGKTTLLKSILGMVHPDEGTITIDGQAATGSYKYRNKVGYMPQISRFPEQLRVRDLFSAIQDIRPEVPREQYDLQLYHQFKMEDIMHQRIATLSGGMAQKASAVLAFMFNPKIIILDEPTAALDPVSAERLKEKIHHCLSEDKLVLVTSHILSDLDEITTDVMYLIQGECQFYEPLDKLRSQTHEQRLNKIITQIMEQG